MSSDITVIVQNHSDEHCSVCAHCKQRLWLNKEFSKLENGELNVYELKDFSTLVCDNSSVQHRQLVRSIDVESYDFISSKNTSCELFDGSTFTVTTKANRIRCVYHSICYQQIIKNIYRRQVVGFDHQVSRSPCTLLYGCVCLKCRRIMKW